MAYQGKLNKGFKGVLNRLLLFCLFVELEELAQFKFSYKRNFNNLNHWEKFSLQYIDVWYRLLVLPLTEEAYISLSARALEIVEHHKSMAQGRCLLIFTSFFKSLMSFPCTWRVGQ